MIAGALLTILGPRVNYLRLYVQGTTEVSINLLSGPLLDQLVFQLRLGLCRWLKFLLSKVLSYLSCWACFCITKPLSNSQSGLLQFDWFLYVSICLITDIFCAYCSFRSLLLNVGWVRENSLCNILVYIFTNTCQIRQSLMSGNVSMMSHWKQLFFSPFCLCPFPPPPTNLGVVDRGGGQKTRSSLLPEKEWTVLKVSNESRFQINLSWLWSLLECQRSSLLALVGWCHSKTHACVSETGLQIWDRLLKVSLWDAFIRNLWKYCQVHVFYFLFSISVLQVWAAMRV